MHVVITGGAGFLGVAVARAILTAGTEQPGSAVEPAAAGDLTVDRLTLVDRIPPPADLLADERVVPVAGDIGELFGAPGDGPARGADVIDGADLVFHLAAAVSGQCETDFDLGMAVNLDGSRAVLEVCRAVGSAPRVVFASSLAVYGAWPGTTLPAVVDDTTLPTPRNSYGIQKLITEQLVADYTRKGFIDGRTVRLMTVSVRPGRPNGAASGFLSGIVREPLRGERAVCPVPGQTRVALSSPRRAVEGLLRAARATSAEWGPPIAVNLPALEVSVDEMVAALADVAGPDVTGLIDWVPDPAVGSIVAGWPARFETERATGLGLRPDTDYRAVIREHLADTAHGQ